MKKSMSIYRGPQSRAVHARNPRQFNDLIAFKFDFFHTRDGDSMVVVVVVHFDEFTTTAPARRLLLTKCASTNDDDHDDEVFKLEKTRL